MQVFFICSAALIPEQPATAFAAEILTIAAFSWSIQLIGIMRYAKARAGHPTLWLVLRIVQTHVASIPLFVAGIVLSMRVDAGLYWLLPGFAFSFVAALLNSWILLIEIMR